jgi:hypothetical protein
VLTGRVTSRLTARCRWMRRLAVRAVCVPRSARRARCGSHCPIISYVQPTKDSSAYGKGNRRAMVLPYTPSKAYAEDRYYAQPVWAADGGTPNEANAPAWPDVTAGITLNQVGDGCHIEGETLAFAWQVVNENPTSPVYVRSNGQVYSIMVQVLGVSFFEPPPV